MPRQYYNSYGQQIRNPRAYAATGAPMYNNFTTSSGKKVYNPESYVKQGGSLYSDKNVNEEKSIYVVNCKKGVKYVGETNNFERRMDEHFNGKGAQVTQKYTPKSAKEIDIVPGYFAKEEEQRYTEKYTNKYGSDKVRGGNYTNSKNLR